MNIDLENTLELAVAWAKEVGEVQRSYFRSGHLELETKSTVHDVVTKVDKLSESMLIERIGKCFPNHSVLGEESGEHDAHSDYLWVVDPLDGTTNYIHDNAPYCVSIALRDKDSLLLGVVYDPCRDECFYAWQGGGAYVNGERMEVSSVQQVEDAFVVTELPYNSDRYARTGEHLIHELYGRVAGIRMTGSAALAICYVAAGRFDAWLEAFIGKWDFSAAALMVLEAGGRITDFCGSDAFLDGHHIIATNGLLHPLFLKLAGEVLPL